MAKFVNSQKRIIKALYKLSRAASINEVAKKAEISWNTAEKHLKLLKKRKIVESTSSDRFWELSAEATYKEHKKERTKE
ncbi:hypothetical protein GOV04_00555 [Candidatus Woesearchaeota archaeon]|nr:hypothetical protein [Candidatus Woesearchaeota archaeon]